MPKCNFNKVAKQLYSNHISARVFSCGNVNLLHICRTTFPKNTFGGLLLSLPCLIKMINDSPQARKFFKRKIEALQYPIFLEFAKLRASRAFAPSCLRAPYVPLCFCTLRALLTHLIFAPGVPFSLALHALFVCLKGDTKLHCTHYSCEVIILFNTSLHKSAFSNDSFGKLVFFVFLRFLRCFELNSI